MRKFILITVSFICLVSAAQQAEVSQKLNSIYADYTSQKEILLKSKFSRKNAAKKIQDYLKFANESLKKIQEEEKDATELSQEGTQVALDIELIAPVQNLAKSKYTAEDCEQANHLNELNNQNDESEKSRIAQIIKTLCK